MKCSICSFGANFLPQWRHKDKNNVLWHWEEEWGIGKGMTQIVHCPKCGEMIILSYYGYNTKKSGAKPAFWEKLPNI